MDHHTLILTDQELIAVSAAIVAYPHHHDHQAMESARTKVRDHLDGKIRANYEDDYGLIHRTMD